MRLEGELAAARARAERAEAALASRSDERDHVARLEGELASVREDLAEARAPLEVTPLPSRVRPRARRRPEWGTRVAAVVLVLILLARVCVDFDASLNLRKAATRGVRRVSRPYDRAGSVHYSVAGASAAAADVPAPAASAAEALRALAPRRRARRRRRRADRQPDRRARDHPRGRRRRRTRLAARRRDRGRRPRPARRRARRRAPRRGRISARRRSASAARPFWPAVGWMLADLLRGHRLQRRSGSSSSAPAARRATTAPTARVSVGAVVLVALGVARRRADRRGDHLPRLPVPGARALARAVDRRAGVRDRLRRSRTAPSTRRSCCR